MLFPKKFIYTKSLVKALIIIILHFAGRDLYAQNDSLSYRIKCADCPKELSVLLKESADSMNANSINSRLRLIFDKLFETGYLLTTIQKMPDCGADSCMLMLLCGPRFTWAKLENGNIPKQLLKSLGYNDVFLSQKPYQLKEINKIRSTILKNCENNGYPFAAVFFDSIIADTSGIVSGKVFLDYGPEITIDSIQIIGKTVNGTEQKVRISNKFIRNYLGLKKGSSYSEEEIRKINKKLRELPYLNVYKTAQVLFQANKANPILFLESRRASRFDVLFGLLPNSNALPGQRRFNFTGNVNIDMLNSLGRGERFIAQWQQFQVGRSELRLGFTYPYLFNSPIGTDFKFELYRRDSTYVDIISNIGLSYLFDGNNYLRVFWKKASTNVQNFNDDFIINNRKLPSILDIRNNAFGVEYYFQRLDYRFNPLKGFELSLDGALGYKYVRKNNSILTLRDPADPVFDFGTLYDSVSTPGLQYSAQFMYAHFFKIWKQLTLMGRYRTAAVFNSKNQLYTNELFRIGGQQMMRGFDEQSIFSSWYQIFTTELRYLLGNNSYTFIFSDFSYSQNRSNEAIPDVWRYGFGVGLALETKVGVFGLSYALGSSFDNPLIIRNGKVHFGYVNMF